MKKFFTVTPLEQVFALIPFFSKAGTETLAVQNAAGRVLAQDIRAREDIPGFHRAAMDGYAVAAKSTFGATEGNPAYLTLRGGVAMGEKPRETLAHGQAMRISTGGMLPQGADSVVMLEFCVEIDDATLEVGKSVAPGANIIFQGEDGVRGQVMARSGQVLRPQEIGLLAALGRADIPVYRRPLAGIISTGNEIVPITSIPGPAQVRDVNSYSLFSQLLAAGCEPRMFGVMPDNFPALRDACAKALDQCELVMISGGSSMGVRDITIEAIGALKDAEILVHGIPIRPGKPTILARVGQKPVWGLPGHVASSMVVFHRVVTPFLEHARGIDPALRRQRPPVPAVLTRNISSAQGRMDLVRVRLIQTPDGLAAEPILGKSGLIHTMTAADGLVEIGMNTEGLEKGSIVAVTLF